MAQVRDSIIEGNLEVTDNIDLKGGENRIRSDHSETGTLNRLIHMSNYGDTIIGYDGYANQDGNTHIYGNDIAHYIASADTNYRPYYRAGDVLNFTGDSFSVRTSGYVTNSGKNVVFTIPVSKPVVGSPSIKISSGKGFVLRQDNNYTHGSTASTFVKPTNYSVVLNPSGFVSASIGMGQ